MAEYGSMMAVSLLAAILFFGGWNGPIPIFDIANVAYTPEAVDPRFLGWLANAAGVANVILKGVIGVTVMMWIRWTLPRLRIDQVMTTCLKYCTPLASFLFLGTVVWQLNHWWTPNLLAPYQGRLPGSIRESWTMAPIKAAVTNAQVTSSEAKSPAAISDGPVAANLVSEGSVVQ